MNRSFVLYNLHDGVTLDEHAKRSQAVDQAIMPRHRGCVRTGEYAIEGAEKRNARHEIVEDSEVESWDVWQETVAGEMEQIPQYADASSAHLIHGRRIVVGMGPR